MSEIEGSSGRVAVPGDRGRRYLDEDEEEVVLGWPEARAWLQRHQVSLAAVALIAVQLLWKARFLSKFYFRQDDFHFTELGLQYGLGWKYLTYVGSGHLHPGVLLLIWVLAKIAPYSWGAASVMSLAMILIASLGCWWMLRTLIGNRVAILIPLALYLVTPLTFPDDSWWSSAIESLPLQAAIFFAVTAHVHYVRSGRYRHVLAAACWLAVGLFFFEKAVVIPAVLFAITAGFLVEGGIGQSLRMALLRYWRAWLTYVIIMGGYLVLLMQTLQSSTVKPTPTSLHISLTFSWSLIRQTLLPGLLGGPWSWVQAPNAAVAYAHPASGLVWIAVIATIAIIATCIAVRPAAWRAWAILAIWVVLADIVPILLGRLGTVGFAQILGLDTRYVADAAPVAALAVGLAFWPAAQSKEAAPSRRRHPEPFAGTAWRAVAVGLTAVVVAGSLWSVSRYEKVTALYNYAGNVYLRNAKASLADLPAGTVIADRPMLPLVMWNIYYDKYGNQSEALAPMESGVTRRNVKWATHFSGTIERLMIFDLYGRLRPAKVSGVRVGLSGSAKCAPVHKGVARLRFAVPSSPLSGILRIGYLASKVLAGSTVTIRYGSTVLPLTVQAGLHSAYFSIKGSADVVTVTNPQLSGFCVGDAEAGNLMATPLG